MGRKVRVALGSEGAIARTADLRYPRSWIEEKVKKAASGGWKCLTWMKGHAG